MTSSRLITLRRLLAAAAIAASAAIAAVPATVYADAPPQKTAQVPGYYRMALGDFEVTALYDGFASLDQKLLKGASAKDIQSLLARMFVSSSPAMQTAVNAYLVNTGKNLILVDAGAAKCFGPTLGGIQDNIRAAGYEPGQVDTVLLTHLHPDHVCGIAADGKPAFPNATVHVAKEEADFWLSEEVASKAPKENQPFFKMARDSIAPYQASDRFKTFGSSDTLVPGVTVMPTPGHTPGHAGYLFSSAKQNLLVWGDLVHSHAVQFARPEVSIEFDVHHKQAIATRKKAFADAAEKKLWVAGMHLPFPGLGHVRAENKGYIWVPVEYAPLAVPAK